MSATRDDIVRATERGGEDVQHFLDRIMVAAQPGAVFGAPIVSGTYTLITASQVVAGGGFGSGLGIGPATAKGKSEDLPSETSEPTATMTSGGGAGGGGGSSGRPVAVITIGPDGVSVKPIFDLTSFLLAGLTAATAMVAALVRLRRVARA